LFSSIDSTDDNTCTTASSAKDSTESASENERRLEIIAEAIRRSARKCAPGEDAIRLSAAGKRLAELRAVDIRIKRRTTRSHVIDLILNMWLRGQLSNIQADHVSEFLRQLNLLQPEYAISVFYALVKRIKPLSTTLFKFVYRCIASYLPDLKKCFARACRSVSEKNKKAAKPTKSAKPTVRAPTIRDIADIEYAVGNFSNDYRAYERDHKDVQHKTMFQCLSPHQASSLAAMAMQSEDTVDAMTNEQFMEMWRETFGFKSSAAVLQALSRLRFAGDYLEPSSWAEHFRLYSLKLAQAPAANHPPSEEVAKMFVNACSRPLLSKDVLAHKPVTLPEALSLVLARLNDNGFMRSAAQSNDTRADASAPSSIVNSDSPTSMVVENASLHPHRPLLVVSLPIVGAPHAILRPLPPSSVSTRYRTSRTPTTVVRTSSRTASPIPLRRPANAAAAQATRKTCASQSMTLTESCCQSKTKLSTISAAPQQSKPQQPRSMPSSTTESLLKPKMWRLKLTLCCIIMTISNLTTTTMKIPAPSIMYVTTTSTTLHKHPFHR
jgi:hypothetical protein